MNHNSTFNIFDPIIHIILYLLKVFCRSNLFTIESILIEGSVKPYKPEILTRYMYVCVCGYIFTKIQKKKIRAAYRTRIVLCVCSFATRNVNGRPVVEIVFLGSKGSNIPN